MTGLIILILTILCFVAIALWVVLKGRKIPWPENVYRTTLKRDGIKLHVMRTEDLSPPDTVLVERSMRAVQAVKKAWIEIVGEKGLSALKEVAVKYVSAESEELQTGVNGTQVWIKAPTGRRQFPVLVIRTEYEPNEHRDPLIAHEAIHALANRYGFSIHANHNHASEKLWKVEGSVEYESRKYYDGKIV